MAQPMTCDMCQAEPGTMMQTNLANGDVIVIGDNCQLAFYLTVAQTIIDGMPVVMLAEYAAAIVTTIDALMSATAQMDERAAPPAGDDLVAPDQATLDDLAAAGE